MMQERETDNVGSELVELEQDIAGGRSSYEIVTAEHLEASNRPRPQPPRSPSAKLCWRLCGLSAARSPLVGGRVGICAVFHQMSCL